MVPTPVAIGMFLSDMCEITSSSSVFRCVRWISACGQLNCFIAVHVNCWKLSRTALCVHRRVTPRGPEQSYATAFYPEARKMLSDTQGRDVPDKALVRQRQRVTVCAHCFSERRSVR